MMSLPKDETEKTGSQDGGRRSRGIGGGEGGGGRDRGREPVGGGRSTRAVGQRR